MQLVAFEQAWHSPSASILALTLSLGVAVQAPVHAVDSAATEEPTAAIDDLRLRVQQLESQLARQPAPPTPPAAASRPAAPNGGTMPPSPGPGMVQIDELAAERALERTLQAEGALLLGPRRFLVEPYLNYTRRETTAPTLVDANGFLAARNVELNQNEYDAGVRVLAGLPFNSQVELTLPYRWVGQTINEPIGLNGVRSRSNSGNSIGDVRIGLATTLLRESGWNPDLVGRVTWNTGTGDRISSGVPLGIGYQEVRAGLTALKRQDPLVFTANLNYNYTLEEDNVQPGDAWGFTLGTSLAASPDTALSLALIQNVSSETRLNGRNIAGSDQVSSILAIGASSIVARRTLLAFTLGVGLADDAPDYLINVALPIQF